MKTALGIDPFAILANDYDALQAALLDGRPAPAGSRFRASVEALARQLQNRHEDSRKSGLLAGLWRPRHKAASGK